MRVTIRRGNAECIEFFLPEGRTVVGRSAECDIHLNDTRVSRRHCVLIREGSNLRILDLSAANGTHVNGRPVGESPLTDGDRVTIGRLTLSVGTPTAGDETVTGVEVVMNEKNNPSDSSRDPWCRDETSMGQYVNDIESDPADGERQVAGGQIARVRCDPATHPIAPGSLLYPYGSGNALRSERRRSVWQSLRYKKTIVAVALAISIPSILAIWSFTRPQYRAVGQVRIRPIIPHLVFQTEESGTIPFYQSYLNTQVGVILSPNVLQRALDQEDVQQSDWYIRPEPLWMPSRTKLERLSEALVVEPRGMTELIDVSLNAGSGADAAVIVNAVLDQYLKYLEQAAGEGTDMMFRRLSKEHKSLKAEVQAREAIADELRKQLGTGEPSELVSRKRVRLDEMQAELDNVRRNLATARLREKDIRAQFDGDKTRTEASAQGELPKPTYHDDPEWSRLRMAVRRSLHEVDLQSQTIGVAHPRMIALKKEVEFARELLASRETQLDGQWTYAAGVVKPAGANEIPVSLAQEIDNTQWEIKRLTYEENLLVEELQKHRSAWGQAFDRAQILDKELASIEQKKQLFEAVRNRLEQKRLERNVPGSIEILARAIEPTVPARDRRLVFTILILGLAVAAGISVAFIRSGNDNSISEVDDLVQVTAAPFLGQLPQVRAKTNHTPMSDPMLNEGIRMVRTSLLHQIRRGCGNVILITSPGPGVGKTTIATLLARSLARCGIKALLVDADMRNPSVAKQMGIESEIGFAEALMGEADEETIVQTEEAGLSVLPGSKSAESIDPELITNGAFTAALARWRKEYEVVLLDSPPVLPVADARILTRHADGTILVAWAERTQRDEMLEAMNHLGLSGGMLLGTVFVSSSRKKRYGSYYRDHAPAYQH